MSVIGIAGATNLGASLVSLAARRGFDVRFYDADSEARSRILMRVSRDVQRLVEREKIDASQRDSTLARISDTDTLDHLVQCDVIVETVADSLARKRAIVAKIDGVARNDTVLVSTSAALSLTSIASASTRPDRVVGMHFIQPIVTSKLVEIVPGLDSAQHSLDVAAALAHELGKTGIKVSNRPGFLVERVSRPYFGEAFRLLDDRAASVPTIDSIMRDFGFKLGPFALLDTVGIDTNLSANIALFEGTFHDPRYRPHPLQAEYVGAGRLGRKSGRGFYEYPEE